MTMNRALLFIACLMIALPTLNLRAQEDKNHVSVAVELVLAVDVSRSMENDEYDLVRQGMARAFMDMVLMTDVLAPGPIAVAVVQWNDDAKTAIDWTILRTTEDAVLFGHQLARMKRIPEEGRTDIRTALLHSANLIGQNSIEGRRRVIDLSGDGAHNGRSNMSFFSFGLWARQGIEINGLPILSDEQPDKPHLVNHFEKYVIAGPNAFVEPAKDFEDFERAFRKKLVRETSNLMM